MLQKNVFVCNKESPHLVMEKIKFECTARREEVKWGSHYSGGKIANIWERFLEIHFTFWLKKKRLHKAYIYRLIMMQSPSLSSRQVPFSQIIQDLSIALCYAIHHTLE